VPGTIRWPTALAGGFGAGAVEDFSRSSSRDDPDLSQKLAVVVELLYTRP